MNRPLLRCKGAQGVTLTFSSCIFSWQETKCRSSELNDIGSFSINTVYICNCRSWCKLWSPRTLRYCLFQVLAWFQVRFMSLLIRHSCWDIMQSKRPPSPPSLKNLARHTEGGGEIASRWAKDFQGATLKCIKAMVFFYFLRSKN